MRTSAISHTKRSPQVGDIVIAKSIHHRYPDIYNGYLSTITKTHREGIVEIRNTEGVWDLDYENSMWSILDTSAINNIITETIKGTKLIHDETYRSYTIQNVIENSIFTDSGIVHFDKHLRKVNVYSLDFVPCLTIRNVTNAIERQYTVFNFELLESILKHSNSIASMVLYTDPFTSHTNKEYITDYLISEILTQET